LQDLHLTFQASRTVWLIGLAVLAAAVTLWTYRKTWPPVGRGYHALLIVLRLLALGLAAVLIFEPVLDFTIRRVRGARVAVLVDRSASMLLPATAAGGEGAPSRLEEAVRMLRETASDSLAVFGFGRTLSRVRDPQELLAAVEDRTDLSQALEQLAGPGGERWDRVYVISDGGVNAGADPLALARRLPPVEIVVVGEPPSAADPALTGLSQARPAYAGGKLEIEFTVSASGLERPAGSGKQVLAVDFFLDDRKAGEKILEIAPGGPRFVSAQVSLPSPDAGSHLLRAVLRPVSGEWTGLDNERLLMAQVAPAKRRMLMVTDALDWDFTFTRRALALNPEWEVDALVLLYGEGNARAVRRQDAKGIFSSGSLPAERELEELDLVLLHGDLGRLDRVFLSRLADRAASGGFALVFWPTGNFNTGVLPENLAACLPFRVNPIQLIPLRAPEAPSALLTLGRYDILSGLGAGSALDNLPPLERVYPPQALKGPVDILAAVAGRPSAPGDLRGAPVLTAQPYGGTRVATVLAQGLWRWHMLTQDAAESHDPRYERLWELLGRWLIGGRKSAGLEIRPGREVYQRGEIETITGTRGQSGGGGEGERVRIAVWSQQAEAADTVARLEAGFRPDSGSFSSALGNLSPGVYRYEGVLEGGNGTGRAGGIFAVEGYSPEMAEPGPDSTVLGGLAAATGGKLVRASGTGGAVRAGRTSGSVTHSIRLSTSLWPYLLIIALLGAEWALRRRKSLA
jgi:hypothetical protein